MSEFPGAQPDSDEVRWNTGPLDETKTEPGDSKKDTGYALDEIPPSVQWNWLLNKAYNLWLHILGRAPREFDTLKEAVVATADLDSVRVRPQSTVGFPNRESKDLFGADKTLAGAAISMCTDGRRVFYVHGTVAVRAIDPETGAEDWADTAGAVNTLVVACDGYRVYVGRVIDGAGPEIEVFDPANGDAKGTDSAVNANVLDLAANGAQLARASGTAIYVYTVGASSITAVGSFNHGLNVIACAIDEKYAYGGGTQGTGNNDLRAVKLSDALIGWSVQFPTTGAAAVKSMVADGDFVYVGTDRIALSAGGNANIFVYSRLGSASWTADLGAGINVTRIYADDRYLYAFDGTNSDTYVLDKRTGVILLQLAGSTDQVFDVDGISAIVTDGSTGWNRRLTRGGTRTFMKGIATNPNRRPYHKLLLPTGGDL